ncbi:MAG: kinase [Deltaproteobacteria bacterium]|jgi:D-glycero-alpha-D-manno-heptose-7-phosphate kinase|nr:kinase [Deltaproteobacteria bacterium]
MIITRTPFRISFFGGGSDYQPFFNEHGGSVLSTTFDKYCYTTVRKCPPFFDYNSQIRYAKTEYIVSTDDIEHPLVRNCMLHLNAHNLNVAYDADLPARSGLGSSSSFAVGLLQALYSLRGQYVDKRQLAEDAIYVERVLCSESGGWQDQVAAAFGGFNRIDFYDDRFSLEPVIISKERKIELENCLLMFFTGISRVSSTIAQSYVKSLHDIKSELLEIKSFVSEAEKILISTSDITDFGKLLDLSWKIKRGLTTKTSTSFVDDIYNAAIREGAVGGKLLGAGGGGFILFFAKPEYHSAIKKVMKGLVFVPISFENSGSRVLYYIPEDDYIKEGSIK